MSDGVGFHVGQGQGPHVASVDAAIAFMHPGAAELHVVLLDDDQVQPAVAVEVGDGDVLAVMPRAGKLQLRRAAGHFGVRQRLEQVGGVHEPAALVLHDAVQPELLRKHQIQIAVAVQIGGADVHGPVAVKGGQAVAGVLEADDLRRGGRGEGQQGCGADERLHGDVLPRPRYPKVGTAHVKDR
ncbi:MAG TPA: hypothetical protein VGR32_03505 [Brevundimonas sp.]|uniref:hypothetical protein n=1 Tax=Brevundimonas sp. TaxID=1871086 RepID=UPI002DEB96BA|nr:hypothetical protein [Brevundimonas sp.]